MFDILRSVTFIATFASRAKSIAHVHDVHKSLMFLLDCTLAFCSIFSSENRLPIRYRIHFKILLLTFKCLHGLAPKYLSDLLTVSEPSRYNLRNHMGMLLTRASVKFKVTLGDRAFKSSAPKLWNSLPLSIRNIQSLNKFKAQIKTYLFKLAFN